MCSFPILLSVPVFPYNHCGINIPSLPFSSCHHQASATMLLSLSICTHASIPINSIFAVQNLEHWLWHGVSFVVDCHQSVVVILLQRFFILIFFSGFHACKSFSCLLLLQCNPFWDLQWVEQQWCLIAILPLDKETLLELLWFRSCISFWDIGSWFFQWY